MPWVLPEAGGSAQNSCFSTREVRTVSRESARSGICHEDMRLAALAGVWLLVLW